MLNRRTTHRASLWLLALLAVAASVSVARAQFRGVKPVPDKAKKSAPKTSISIDLLADRFASGINSQRWGSEFRKYGITVRIRQPLLDDKPEVTERMRGRLRFVKAVGTLKRDGSIQFPDRTFRLSDSAKIKEWPVSYTHLTLPTSG